MNSSYSYQESFEPSYFYNIPAVILFESSSEPAFGPENSRRYLEAYPTQKGAMRKAKNFWLKGHKYGPEREQIRRQYPEETEFLKKKLWVKHTLVMEESYLNKGFFKTPRLPCQIPEEFSDLAYYARVLEPIAHRTDSVDGSLPFFLNAKREDASRNWSLSVENLQYIQENYPEKVEELKLLLWQRHLVWEEERAREAQSNREISFVLQQEDDRLHHFTAIITSLVAALAACTFAAFALALCQPVLYIPACIFLLGVVAAPTTYSLTR